MVNEHPNPTKRATILKIIKNMVLYTIVLIFGYLAIGYFLHLGIFPEKKPNVSTYFKPGHVYYSKVEGFRQTVMKQENGLVHCSLEIEPYAPGPPKHIHSGFDEYFEVENGELSVWMDGEIKKIKTGEILHVPKGTPHKPFNETADTIHLKGTMTFPEKFAFGLVQVYGLMDHNQDFGELPATLFMLAPIQQAGDFDAYLVEGPPVFIQKSVHFLITPAARLMGYKSFYKEYDISKER
jgi:mannose-6-phosphate isomerase-like protein (cupin superfamily)